MISKGKAFSGALLVSGTAIGAGMLALPVVTAAGGFLPACVIYLLCWAFMASTGLLLLEICLWMPHEANLVTMAAKILGKGGKIASWILYLFLFYCLTVAYVSGGGGFFHAVSQGYLSPQIAPVAFTLFFAPFVYLGTKAVDRSNFLLMIGLIVSYLSFIVVGVKLVDVELLKHTHWTAAISALPLIFTSFSYQGVIPSLTAYLHRNPKAIRFAIILGSAIPFVIYIIWEFLILGIIPLEGPQGLLTAQAQGQTAVFPLQHIVSSSNVYLMGQIFAFCALTTSFLGVTLGLRDFLADGLKVEKTPLKRVMLCAMVYLPPLLISISYPGIFLSALNHAGGIGCALLLGLMPILMVWVGRYKKKFSSTHPILPGGKIVLSLLLLFVLVELAVEFFHL